MAGKHKMIKNPFEKGIRRLEIVDVVECGIVILQIKPVQMVCRQRKSQGCLQQSFCNA